MKAKEEEKERDKMVANEFTEDKKQGGGQDLKESLLRISEVLEKRVKVVEEKEKEVEERLKSVDEKEKAHDIYVRSVEQDKMEWEKRRAEKQAAMEGMNAWLVRKESHVEKGKRELRQKEEEIMEREKNVEKREKEADAKEKKINEIEKKMEENAAKLPTVLQFNVGKFALLFSVFFFFC